MVGSRSSAGADALVALLLLLSLMGRIAAQEPATDSPYIKPSAGKGIMVMAGCAIGVLLLFGIGLCICAKKKCCIKDGFYIGPVQKGREPGEEPARDFNAILNSVLSSNERGEGNRRLQRCVTWASPPSARSANLDSSDETRTLLL